MDNERNPREELYQRFKKSLTQAVNQRYFDEDELVEIFDYAGDLQDDYVQLEVLLCGARLYPESTGLSERRLLFYLDTSEDDTDQRTEAASKYLADNPDTTSILFDIARMETNPGDDPEASLEYILHQYDSFGDEETIRFVDLAIDLGQYKWLIDHLDEISSKVPYKPTLLYEIAREADSRYDNETLVRTADGLIEAEPFTVGYWIMLFRGQARLDRRDDARTTYDSAKALAADDPEAMLAIADTVYTSAPYLLGDMAETLRSIKEQHSDDFNYTDAYCAMLVQMGNMSGAINEIKAYLDRKPGNVRAVRQLLMCNAADSRKYVEQFFAIAESDAIAELDIESLAQGLCMRGAMRSVNALLSTLDESQSMTEPYYSMWVEALFALGHYDKVVELGQRQDLIDSTMQMPLKGASMAFAYTVSLLKCGKFDDAKAFADKMNQIFQSTLQDVPLPLRMAINCFMSLIPKISNHGDDKLYWEYFDPLGYDKFQS